jgi:hypothetical protein
MADVQTSLIAGQIGDLINRVRVLEANQLKAESDTTGCLAAGGGIEQGKPDRLAGREPWLELMEYIDKTRFRAKAEFERNKLEGSRACWLAYEDCYEQMRQIEARRRSTGCA